MWRYLLGKKRVKQWFIWQTSQYHLVTCSDADWAGCRISPEPTTGGAVTTGRRAIKVWSATQSLEALSSGESELYARLSAAAETFGIVVMYKGFGMKMIGEVWGDAPAALGIINRNDLGKTRHIDAGLLWIQQTVAEQRLKFDKVFGKDNPADLCAKHFDWQSIGRQTARFECEVASIRADEAPQLHQVSEAMLEYELMGEPKQWPLLNAIILAFTNEKKSRSTAKGRGDLNGVTTECAEKPKQTSRALRGAARQTTNVQDSYHNDNNWQTPTGDYQWRRRFGLKSYTVLQRFEDRRHMERESVEESTSLVIENVRMAPKCQTTRVVGRKSM